REQQRLAAYERAVALVHRRRDDQVHLTQLVLEQHEDDALCGRGTLPCDRHPCHTHTASVTTLSKLVARQHTIRQVWPQQLERVHADGEIRHAVVREHPLPRSLLAQPRRLDRRIERQRQLSLLATRPRDVLRVRHEPELPQ